MTSTTLTPIKVLAVMGSIPLIEYARRSSRPRGVTEKPTLAPSARAIKNKASLGQEHLKPPRMAGENCIKSAFFFKKKFIYKIATRNNSLQMFCQIKEKNGIMFMCIKFTKRTYPQRCLDNRH